MKNLEKISLQAALIFITFYKYFFICMIVSALIINISCNEKDENPTTAIKPNSIEFVDTKGDTILLEINHSHPCVRYKHPKNQ